MRRRPYGKVGEANGVRERRLDGKPPVSKSGIAGSSPAAPAKPGQRKNPVTDNPYTITAVSQTEEQEL